MGSPRATHTDLPDRQVRCHIPLIFASPQRNVTVGGHMACKNLSRNHS